MKKIIIGMALVSTILCADFARSDAGVVTDSKTGLQWQDDYSDNENSVKNTTWAPALTYCQGLELDDGGWRLPNINELKSIIKDRVVAPMIDDAFDNTNTSGGCWSSTTGANGSNYAWYVYFSNGGTYNDHYKSHNYYVRCVRSGQ